MKQPGDQPSRGRPQRQAEGGPDGAEQGESPRAEPPITAPRKERGSTGSSPTAGEKNDHQVQAPHRPATVRAPSRVGRGKAGNGTMSATRPAGQQEEVELYTTPHREQG